jgi:hypothetical protein
VFEVLLRNAPGGLTVSGDPSFLSDWQAAYPPLRAQTAPALSDQRRRRRQRGPVAHGEVRRDVAA